MRLGRVFGLLALTAAGCQFQVGPDRPIGAPMGDEDAATTPPPDLAVDPEDFMPPADLVATPILMGQRQTVPGTVDLTSEGKADWIHFGLNISSDVNRKASGGQALTMTASTTLGQYGGYVPAYSWTDGTPTASTTTHAGVYLNGVGNAFTIEAPASAVTQTVHVYVTSFGAHATFTAHLSDGAAADFVDTMITGGSNVFADYQVTFRDPTPGAKLTLSWTLSAASGYASVDLMAATLQ